MKHKRMTKIKKEIKKDISKIIKSRIEYFFIGGFLVFLIELGLTILLTEQLFVPVRISYFTSLTIGLFFLYFFHKKITFRIKRASKIKDYEKFIFTYTLSYFSNWLIVSLLIIRINYMIVIPLVSLSLGVLNYLINRYWVFTKK
jgi:putative flippase GtrA